MVFQTAFPELTPRVVRVSMTSILMFNIIGADGKTYGPVSAEQIRAWIVEGRCNASTQARSEGGAEWKPLPHFPEFAGSFPPPPPTPVATGTTGIPAGTPSSGPAWQSAPPAGIAGIPAGASSGPAWHGSSTDWLLARDYDLDVGDCLGRGWNLLTSNFWPAVGITFLASLLMTVPIINYAVIAGLFHYFLKLRRGEKGVLEDIFAGFSERFLHLFLAGLIGHLLMSVGFLFCILPGIYLAVCWQFSLPLVLEKKMDFWDAMELSRKMVAKHWFSVFFLMVVAFFFCQLLGILAFVIGVYITLPWAFAAMACAYYMIFEPAPPPPGPDLSISTIRPSPMPPA